MIVEMNKDLDSCTVCEFCCSILGADLLRLTKQDMIQILGPADGIRLHNSLQARC